MYPSIIVNNNAKKDILEGKIWLTQSVVVGRKPITPGVVRLLDKKRNYVATAFVSPHSKIFLRIFEREDAAIDKNYWRKKISTAYAKRTGLSKTTDAFRVVYAESDNIPSVVIDKYNDIFSIQTTSTGAETIKKDLIDIIVEDFKPASVIEKNAASVRKKEGLELIERVIFGDKTATEIFEGSERFFVDVLRGQKTGAYLDYRNIRLKAGILVKGRALDAFCYQGWTTCHLAGRAKSVVAIDASKEALSIALRNAQINGHKNIEWIKADVFKYISTCGEKFDFIHLDPPSFVKSRREIKPAVRGYEKLVSVALKLLNDGGIIMISSCSHHISERMLEETVLKCITKTGFKCKRIFAGIQDADHPVLLKFPESMYLKAAAYIANKP